LATTQNKHAWVCSVGSEFTYGPSRRFVGRCHQQAAFGTKNVFENIVGVSAGVGSIRIHAQV
jgi:hypothetical protein